MNFIKQAMLSNKEIFYGILGGTLMFTLPVLVDLYVRPILHTLY